MPGLVLSSLFAFGVAALTLAFGLPLLRARLLAEINARSDHRHPTPNGGGLLILIGAFAALGVSALSGRLVFEPALVSALVCLLATGVLGLGDDLVGLSVRFRLLAGAGASAAALGAILLGAGFSPVLTAVLVVPGVIFVVGTMNGVNFIDGSDLITAAHAAPGMGGFALAFWLGGEAGFALVAAAFLGGILGFVPWNWPPARIFMGDTGSLPVGFALGLFAVVLSMQGAPVAAALFLAYPLADAALTLLARARAGAKLSEAHRDHAYQKARDAGWPALRVAGYVLALQAFCVTLGLLSLHPDAPAASLFALGAAAVAAVLTAFRAAGR